MCEKVYVPPRGACPTDGVPTRDQVELPHNGTVVSFCIVNVAFYGQAMEIPYTSALILLDGADLPIMHLIQECPVEDVRIGLRVEAVWVARRRARPDPREHPLLPAQRRARRRRAASPATTEWEASPMRDVAVVAFGQTKHVRADDSRNEVEMLMPVVAEALERRQPRPRTDIGFTCSGSRPTTSPGRRSRS